MGSRVSFSRAPREGVHRIVAGDGIGVSPESGLGDVTLETLHWRPPVQSSADLPSSGNQPGDARVVIGEGAIYVWTGGGWAKISGDGGGGGGSGGGFVLDERLNHLRGQIRVSQLHAASRFNLHSEFVDDFNDMGGIDQGASSGGYTTVSSRLQLQTSTIWQKKYPPTSPPPLNSHAMAYDKGRGVVVLFGGKTSVAASTAIAETWEWDGTTWIKKEITGAPRARFAHKMVYDEKRGVVLLFGGQYLSGSQYVYLNDTWVYDGTTWKQLYPQTIPPGRSYHGMAYDSRRGVVVMFGGSYGSIYRNDTWEWDGSNWIQRSPATMPSARYGHDMVFDSARGVVVLFGGDGGSRLSDTWEYDGVNWVKKSPTSSPSARSSHAIEFDPTRNLVVLFGGYISTGPTNDIWEYDGNTWANIAAETAPDARYVHDMVWDDGRKEIILYGGYRNIPSPDVTFDDTWGYAKYGQATVVLNPLTLPWVPRRAYLTVEGVGGSFSVSRDGGETWTPISPDSEADLSAQPSGSILTVKIDISGNEYVDAIGVGASNI